MKCFVTGRSSNFEEVVRVTNLLQDKGHTITHDWTVLPMIKPYADNAEKAGEYATMQVQGIADAEVYILLAHHDGTGVFAELGAALAIAQMHETLKIYGVSREIPEAMFHYHPAIVWKESIQDVIAELV